MRLTTISRGLVAALVVAALVPAAASARAIIPRDGRSPDVIAAAALAQTDLRSPDAVDLATPTTSSEPSAPSDSSGFDWTGGGILAGLALAVGAGATVLAVRRRHAVQRDVVSG